LIILIKLDQHIPIAYRNIARHALSPGGMASLNIT
jgi:hypothetical protein